MWEQDNNELTSPFQMASSLKSNDFSSIWKKTPNSSALEIAIMDNIYMDKN